MKKFGIIALAALLVVAFTVPASALENVFGGYWRTRFVTQQNFTGEDLTETNDLVRVDTRTRLYYTAILNENLKFVNKFEFNTVWGDAAGGALGADGNTIVVKNSYADFNLGPVNAKVGIQGLVLSRGWLMDDDFSGLMLTYKGEGFSIPFVWVKAYEGYNAASAPSINDQDADFFGLAPTFTLGEGISINPIILWATSDDISAWAPTFDGAVPGPIAAKTELDAWYWGLNADMKFGPASIFFTGMVLSGDISVPGAADTDLEGYMLNLGGAYDMGMFDIHGEFFYVSGDNNAADNDLESFVVPQVSSHYWAEIMGLGIMDQDANDIYAGGAANAAIGDTVWNVWAVNLGTKVKPMDKLTVKFDLWYAELAEDTNGALLDETIGTEADLVVTYELVEGLNLDVVAAMLFADDAADNNSANDANPYELGARLSFSF